MFDVLQIWWRMWDFFSSPSFEAGWNMMFANTWSPVSTFSLLMTKRPCRGPLLQSCGKSWQHIQLYFFFFLFFYRSTLHSLKENSMTGKNMFFLKILTSISHNCSWTCHNDEMFEIFISVKCTICNTRVSTLGFIIITFYLLLLF